MKKSPLMVVKEQFGGKEKLVSEVQRLATDELFADRVNPLKGLSKVSNAKLLRLHEVLTTVKNDFGGRNKLIDSILELEKRSKDAGLRTRLARYSTPRLLDMHRAASRRRKTADAKNARRATVKAKKKPRSKKAKAKGKKAA